MKIQELAKESLFDEVGKDYSLYFNVTKEKVEQFAALVRNATLEEAASVCDIVWNGDSGTYIACDVQNDIADTLRKMKEPMK